MITDFDEIRVFGRIESLRRASEVKKSRIRRYWQSPEILGNALLPGRRPLSMEDLLDL